MNVEVLHLPPAEIRLLETNAHYMPPDKFARLVANVSADGQLTSTPFVWWNEGKGWECLSGNHRVKAAIESGLETIICLGTRDPLTLDQRLAIQLSHNSLVGEDDPALLKRLYEDIADIDLKAYSGLSDKSLKTLPVTSLPPLPTAQLEFRTVTILFLPDELERIEGVIKEALALAAGEVWTARLKDYQAFGQALEQVSAAYNVKNRAVLLMVLMDMLATHIDELEKGWTAIQDSTRHWIPIASLFGNAYMPAEAARQVQTAIDVMLRQGDISKTNKWQALEFLAAEFLAGVDYA